MLLLDGLDGLILDEADGAAYASVLYRTRLEGVNDTALLGTCEPDRVGELSAASPELTADLRAVRLPDLSARGRGRRWCGCWPRSAACASAPTRGRW